MLRIHFVSPKVSSGYPRIIKKENRKLDEAAPKGDHEVIEQRSPPPTSCYKFLFLFLYISLVPDWPTGHHGMACECMVRDRKCLSSFSSFSPRPSLLAAKRWLIVSLGMRKKNKRRKKRKRLFLFLVPLHKAATAVSSRSFTMTLWRRGTRKREKEKELLLQELMGQWRQRRVKDLNQRLTMAQFLYFLFSRVWTDFVAAMRSH